MSLLILPRPNSPTNTICNTGVDVEDAIDALTSQRSRIERNGQAGHLNVRDRLNTVSAYVSFPLPKSQGDVDALLAAEDRIATLLKTSRVPGASGERGVFVDLVNGHLLVSTSVFFNERNAAIGVMDDSLIHKLDLVSRLLTLNDFSQAPAPAVPVRFEISNLPPAVLATAELVLNGSRYSLDTIQGEVEPLDDQD